MTAPDFSNGFPGQPVNIGFPRWDGLSSIPLRAAAKSLQPSVMLDSTMIAATATSIKKQLRMPILFERPSQNGMRRLQIVPDIGAG